MHTIDQRKPVTAPVEGYLQSTASDNDEKADTPRFLITLDRGIGDAVVIGLSVVEQIIENDPTAFGKIDVLCNKLQAQIFQYDPRINRVIPSGQMAQRTDLIETRTCKRGV
jgi:ADP-heptose:LPS heptosyltransferase